MSRLHSTAVSLEYTTNVPWRHNIYRKSTMVGIPTTSPLLKTSSPKNKKPGSTNWLLTLWTTSHFCKMFSIWWGSFSCLFLMWVRISVVRLQVALQFLTAQWYDELVSLWHSNQWCMYLFFDQNHDALQRRRGFKPRIRPPYPQRVVKGD